MPGVTPTVTVTVTRPGHSLSQAGPPGDRLSLSAWAGTDRVTGFRHESGTVRPAAPGPVGDGVLIIGPDFTESTVAGRHGGRRVGLGPDLSSPGPGPPRPRSEPAEAGLPKFRIMLKPASEFNRRLVADSDSG
eukprot:661715-Hanusia_phi.AAC.1